MEKFNIYLPIQKGIDEKPETNKIIEDSAGGESRTRHKMVGTISTTSLDRDHERVSKECLKSMENSIKLKRLPIFSNHNHDWEEMIGYATEATLEGDNLQAVILTDYEETNPKVKQLMGKMEAGFPLGLSIGGKVTKDTPAIGKDARVIDEVELFEASVVGIGSNPNAFLGLSEQISKSLKEDADIDIIKGEDKMTGKILKQEEEEKPVESKPEEESKSEGEEEEKPVVTEEKEETEAPKEEEPIKSEEEEEGVAYEKFCKYMQKYLEEVKAGTMKAEGEGSEVPGAENADPENTIEGKSIKTFQTMRKAFQDGIGSESIVKGKKQADYSFKALRRQMVSGK